MVSDKDFTELSLGSLPSHVVKPHIRGGMEVDSFSRGPQGMLEYDGEIDAIENRGKHAALHHVALHIELC